MQRPLAGKYQFFPFGRLIRLPGAVAAVVAAGLIAASSGSVVLRSQGVPALSAADVNAVLRAAAEAVGDSGLSVAVVDRRAAILGVYARPGASPTGPDIAVTTARTAALFSNNQAPLSSRTIRFISGIHFPPGVSNTAAGPLYGVENINRGCQLTSNENEPYPRPRSIVGSGVFGGPLPCRPSDTRGCAVGLPIANGSTQFERLGISTGKTDVRDRSEPGEEPVNPGGFALYRAGQVVGAVGVSGLSPERAEYAAFVAAAATTAQTGLSPLPVNPLPAPGAVFIDGLRLPFFGTCSSVQCVLDAIAQGPPGGRPGSFTSGDILVSPRAGQAAPEGYLIGPRASDPARVPSALRFSTADVERIVNQAIARANVTRAQVRLPLTQTAKMVIAVTDSAGDILALYRMQDALADAVDVVPSKARNAYYFSTREGYDVLRSFVENSSDDEYRWTPNPPAGQGWAVTSRTLGFGGQPLFPPGIDRERGGGTPGPWFGLFLYDTANPCTEGPGPSRGGDRNFLNQNGITWFPGSAPLYRGAVLAGGVGISGDGIDQNDYVTASAVAGFEAPTELRVDQSFISTGDGALVRLPYLKFPRNPELR